MMKNKCFYIFSLFLFVFGLSQCGDIGGRSGDVSIKFIPDNPIVIKSDLVGDGTDDDVIKGPWFYVSLRVRNSSDRALHLVSMNFSGQSAGSRGSAGTFEIDFDPTKSTVGGIDCEDRRLVAVIPAGATYETLTSCDPEDIASGLSGLGRYERWYVTGLPDTGSYIFNVEARGEGYFVDENEEPIERLVLRGFFVTR